MKESIWMIEIDSDLGPINVLMTYEIDPGSQGDYYTPGESPRANIIKIEFEPLSPEDIDNREEYEDEILNWEYEDRSEDYYDKTER